MPAASVPGSQPAMNASTFDKWSPMISGRPEYRIAMHTVMRVQRSLSWVEVSLGDPGVALVDHAPTDLASQRNTHRSIRPNPKSSITSAPKGSASKATQMSRPSSTSRRPSASGSPNSEIIHASGVRRSACCCEASCLARIPDEQGEPPVVARLPGAPMPVQLDSRTRPNAHQPTQRSTQLVTV